MLKTMAVSSSADSMSVRPLRGAKLIAVTMRNKFSRKPLETDEFCQVASSKQLNKGNNPQTSTDHLGPGFARSSSGRTGARKSERRRD